jgi:hypothetical protein
MKLNPESKSLTSTNLNRRIGAYLAAAGALGAASEAQAIVVSNNTVQSFGINGAVNLDFNNDGQTDFQIDHDRVDLTGQGGPVVDFLQADKNDINGAGPGENPLAFDPGPDCCFQATPFQDGATTRNNANNAGYVVTGPQGSYPAALGGGAIIGPTSSFDYQEGSNFQGSGKWIRANRLIDEDHTQVDQLLGGRPASGVQVPFGSPGFTGLNGDVAYLGLKMDLNGTGNINYGYVGIRITNEADATGQVVGYAYETVPNVPIVTPVTVPEPATICGAFMGIAMLVCVGWRRLMRR